jgi:hypothetical protein
VKKQNRRGLSSQLHDIPEAELVAASCAYADPGRLKRKYRRRLNSDADTDGNDSPERLRSESRDVESEGVAGRKLRTG